jgi:hypothetical protein
VDSRRAAAPVRGTGDSSSLYRLRAPDAAGRISWDPERITFGTGIETRIALGAGGWLALATEVRTSHLWPVPADTNRGKVTGEMSLLTREASFDAFPQISEDGRRVVLRSEAFGQAFGPGKLFLLDLDTGSRRPLAPAWNADWFAPLVRGGTRVLFSGVASNGERGGYVLDLGGGAPTLLKSDAFCWSASADGRFFLDGASDTAIEAIDTGTRSEFRFASGEQLRSPYFSPDGRWVALHVRSTEVTRQIFVLPFHEGRETPRDEWIPVTDGKRLDREPKWSPDGNLLCPAARRAPGSCRQAAPGEGFALRVRRPLGVATEMNRARSSGRVRSRTNSVSSTRGRMPS